MSASATSPPDFWPDSGLACLRRDEQGALQPSAEWWRRFLDGPEMALVEDSCGAEQGLHAALRDAPEHAVTPQALGAIEDADARANYQTFIDFRDALRRAGSLQAWYLDHLRRPGALTAPAFVTAVVHGIVHALLDDTRDAFEARAAELLFRPQRVTLADGRVLCADLAVIDGLNETHGFGDIGRLLVQADAPLAALDMPVLTPDNSDVYWRRAGRHELVLDLTHEVSRDVGHGLSFTLRRAHSGLAALARVLEKWTWHLLGTRVTITPLPRIDDAAWRWHVGLDAHSMAILNDLYEDRIVEPDRLARLIGLFRLDFADPGEMRADVAGCPVYLGLATADDGVLKLKPQNLLLNLPLAVRS